MKNPLSALAIVAVLCCISNADAQRRQTRGQREGQLGGPPAPGMNQMNFNRNRNQQQLGNQAAMNQNGNQNMPSVQQLAQMMIANFDADGSGELGQAELQSALSALRQRMLNQAGVQNEARQQLNGFADRQNGFQARQNLQRDQGQGNRPAPPRGQGNARRAR